MANEKREGLKRSCGIYIYGLMRWHNRGTMQTQRIYMHGLMGEITPFYVTALLFCLYYEDN